MNDLSKKPDGVASTEAADRSNPDYIVSVRFSDFEQEMADRFGERFVDYRRDYYKSLNYDKNGFLPDFPLTLQVELVNRCNLSCKMCYTINHSEAKATLDVETLTRVFKEGQENGLPALMLGMGAESLVYKPIREVVDAAQDADIMDIFFSTNGILLNEKMARYLVEREVPRLVISLDAATPETYLKIRGKDELENIEANIHRLIAIKKELGTRFPVLRLSFCVQEENYHERQAFLDKWKDVADYVDFQQLVDFDPVTELVETGDVAEKPAAPAGMDHPVCQYPFNSLNIWANGDITPCCTFFGKALVLGNVKDQTLKEAWNGEEIEKIRDQFRPGGTLCPTCEVCLYSREEENFTDTKGVGSAAKPAAE
ncbi:MAG: hypothetical protein CMM61_07780 [Rhodospirillaceae bacterium]|nr:hypothetical protein [Rhodospirillaceae bacterium]